MLAYLQTLDGGLYYRQHDRPHSHRSCVGRSQQRVLTEVGIPLGGLDLRVPEDVLDLVQGPSRVDQQTRKRVAQVVHPDCRRWQ